jgi:peptide/nickel transport system substrate-binding protein
MALVLCGSLLALVACAPPSTTRPSPAEPPQVQQAAPVSNRTLVVVNTNEPVSLNARPLTETFISYFTVRQIFNASLVVLDDKALPRARLAEAVPQLNSETWRVSPDGRMETTWRLKPDLVWHDGAPLTAEDFVFAWRLYSTPELGVAVAAPINQMEEVAAPDPWTVVVRWRQLTAQAVELEPDAFGPLPRHILEERFRQAEWDAVITHPFWKREFVGTGPFRLVNWEPGAFIEAEAFDRFVEGRPKIPRVRIVFRTDVNAALATMLAGEADLSPDGVLNYVQEAPVRSEFVATGRGNVLLHPAFWRMVRFQARPDLTTPRSLLEARVRKALASAVDMDAINESLYGGNALLADTMIPRSDQYYSLIERAITRYPLDLRRAEQLMAEAGFRKGADGVYVSPSEGRFSSDFRGAANQPDFPVLAVGWRNAGFDIQETLAPAALNQNPEYRATFPGMNHFNSFLGERGAYDFTSREIPAPENRWTGGNRGGWADAEYDRLAAQLTTTLNRADRGPLVAQLMKRWTDELPAIPMNFSTSVWTWVKELQGPADTAAGSAVAWNISQWEFR